MDLALSHSLVRYSKNLQIINTFLRRIPYFKIIMFSNVVISFRIFLLLLFAKC